MGLMPLPYRQVLEDKGEAFYFVKKTEVRLMKWIMVLLAGVFEITWAVAMKYSNGFKVLVPTIIKVKEGSIITYWSKRYH